MSWPNPWTEPYVSRARAAEILSLSVSTIYRLVAEGQIPTGYGKRIPTAALFTYAGLPIPAEPVAPPPRHVPRVL